MLYLPMFKETLMEAVAAGAKVIQQYFHTRFTITHKDSINNLVTAADHASEKAIFEVIRERFPDHYLLSEERGAFKTDSPYKWIIDPLDGTVNFAHGIPVCCVSIALETEGKVEMGAVYNPFMNELFFAEKGKGAFLNGEKISVSNEHEVMKSCLATGFPYVYPESGKGPADTFSALVKKGIPVRRLGSAAIDLCWVAAGRFDGYYEYSLQPWDSAAGALIVQEAGGVVTNFNGSDYNIYEDGLISSNGFIHQGLMNVVNEHGFLN